MRTAILIIVLAANYAIPGGLRAAAAACTAASGGQRVALLELYTSEGCDSCPSADKWVGELPSKKLGAERVLALAFHVDYWNQLGWADPYSQAMFSERQRQHSRRRGASFVFTPQLLLNGQDYRRALVFDDIDSKVRAINHTKPQAAIRLQVAGNASALDGKVDVSVAGGAEQRRAQVFLALYENNLTTAVKAGENKGRVLRHDFVVRELVGPLALDGGGNLTLAHSFALDPRWKTQDTFLAVFVQHPGTGEVLQALAAACR